MTTLAEWLEAQIAEDERIAQAAGRAVIDRGHPPADVDEYLPEGMRWASVRWLFSKRPVATTPFTETTVAEGTPAAVSDQIARWDPARVLAECNAKRRIIELHNRMHECSTLEDNGDVNSCTWVYDEDCTTLQLLAAVFEGRPGYQETWQ